MKKKITESGMQKLAKVYYISQRSRFFLALRQALPVQIRKKMPSLCLKLIGVACGGPGKTSEKLREVWPLWPNSTPNSEPKKLGCRTELFTEFPSSLLSIEYSIDRYSID